MKLKVCFIWPHGFLKDYSIPLPFAYLKSNLDPNLYEVKIIDCAKLDWKYDDFRLANEISSFHPDVVGISSWSPMFPEVVNLFDLCKSLIPNCVTVLGGPHGTTYYQMSLLHKSIDFVMRGEAEFSFPKFLEKIRSSESDYSNVEGLAYRKGDVIQANSMDRPNPLDKISAPDFRFIDLFGYNKRGYRWNSPNVPTAPLWVTRGCPYRCQYCSSPQLNGKEIRKHSVEYVIRQIQALYSDQGIRWFNIIDDNFTFDVEFAKDFCRKIIELNLRDVGFGTPNGIRMTRGDVELWRLMKKAGWRQIIIAPESGSQHTLSLMKKDLKLGLIPEKVREIKSADLKVQAFFIVGYPGESIEDIEETFRLIRRCKFNFVFLANFHPIPGTPVYKELVDKGEIPDGLLPHNFSDGIRAYTPQNLRDFNFGAFFFRTHLMLMLTYPSNIPYHLKVVCRQFPTRMIFEKLLKLLLSVFRRQPTCKVVASTYWKDGMHFQNQNTIGIK